MLKKILFISLLFCLSFSLVNPVSAQIFSKTGSAIISGPTYDSSKDAYIIVFDKSVVRRNLHQHFTDDTFTTIRYESDNTIKSNWTGEQYLNCKRYTKETYYDSSNRIVGQVTFFASSISNDTCESGYTDSDGSGGGAIDTGGTCDSCGVFSCPAWGDYMGKIDTIISKIPPVPNWEKVAGTFRDVITPQIKKDLEDTIGRAPNPPATPNTPTVNKPSLPGAPSAPSLPGDLDDGGIKEPTGKEAEGLDGSTFSEDDIKNESIKIKEREDDSGGFKINDPINALPSQDEFMKNLPKPESGESKNPDEQDIPSPKEPTEQENNSPSPKEDDNKAPSPSEGDNKAPSPKEDDNEAPTPGEEGNAAPIPKESGTAPLPDSTNEKAPIPGG